MSLINEYRATEEAIKELQARLKNLSQDDKLQTELEFEGKLRTLMGEYSKSLRDIIALLDPESKVKAPRGAVKTTGTKRARKVKKYKNPHNGERQVMLVKKKIPDIFSFGVDEAVRGKIEHE